MSIRIMSLIFEAHFENCKVKSRTVSPSTAKFVCLALADHANDEGKGAYPSVATLAKKVDMTPRTVIFALRALEENNIIKAVGKSEYQTTDYSISIFELEKLARNAAPISRAESDDTLPEGLKVTTSTPESDDRKSVSLSVKPSLKPSINHTGESPKNGLSPRRPLSSEEAREQTRATLERGLAAHSGNADYSWLPEGLRPLAVAFGEATGFDCPKYERNLWRKTLLELQEGGINPDIIKSTVQYMQTNNLTIGSPGSLLKIARSRMAKQEQGQFDLPPTFRASEHPEL